MKNSHEHTPEERAEAIRKMRIASDNFYKAARFTNVHAFIEFCGLMNEFIVMCEKANQEGIDFLFANTHNEGASLPFMEHNAAYLAEKLDCIYGPAMATNPKAREMFLRTFLGSSATL